MSICKFLPLEKEILTSTYLYGGVKVRCRVVPCPRSVIVHILDGRFNRFRTRRFTEATFVGLDKFHSLVNSIKDESIELQSLAVSHLVARIAIESLCANETIQLYNSYSPISKGW